MMKLPFARLFLSVPIFSLFGGLACGANSAPSTSAEGSSKKPNIIVIVSDDQGYHDLGVYGCKDVPTPNIDSLAKNGVRFTDAYVTSPVCSPSRAGIMSGHYGERFGFEFLADPDSVVPAGGKMGISVGEKTLGNRMQALGYSTGMIGKWHLGFLPEFLPQNRGFAEVYGSPGQPSYEHKPQIDTRDGWKPVETGTSYYVTDDLTDRAVDFIQRNKEQPFFLYLAHKAVHKPLSTRDKYLSRFPVATTKKGNDRRIYSGMLSALDDGVGRVMDTVRKLGLEDNTLVFYISDNGALGPGLDTPLRGGKGTTWEGGIRVPFLMQWKEHLPAGFVYSKPVSSLDIMPTAIAAAGGQVDPAWKLDGVNLLPYLQGKNTGSPHDLLYWRLGSQWAVRSGDWKLVVGREKPGGNIQIAYVGEPRLYNLKDDVSETHDLAAANPERVKQLRDTYEQWNKQLMTPLWQPNPVVKGGDSGGE